MAATEYSSYIKKVNNASTEEETEEEKRKKKKKYDPEAIRRRLMKTQKGSY